MSYTHFNAAKIHHTKQFCVQYQPIDAQAERPSLDALWQALSTYNGIIFAKRPAVPAETAFRTLKDAALAARATYPHIRLEVLEDNREMFTW